MDAESYGLDAHWGPRRETAAACAVRLARMLEGLASIDPIYARWYRPAMTRAEATEPFCSMPPVVEELRKVFEAEEDSSIAAWNGIDEPRGLKFMCRAGSDAGFPVFPNWIEIPARRRQPENADLLTVAVLKPMLLSLVAAWDPDWASVYSRSYTRRLFDPTGRHLPPFRSGWMTYLPLRLALRVSPPPSAIVERTPGGGLLMLATEEPFTVENPDHVAVADAIQACLAPLQP
jgi:hypothetical protein